jgi:hypothetical protein
VSVSPLFSATYVLKKKPKHWSAGNILARALVTWSLVSVHIHKNPFVREALAE